jgi:type II secretory pathway pseudopilin PulG
MGCLIMSGSAGIAGRPVAWVVAARPAPAGGFTYIGLLMAIVIIGGALAAVGEVWSTESQREREAELLYRGDAIRLAIGAYMYGIGGAGVYPRALQDLVQDERAPEIKRYLRRVYEDPITGMADWTLILAPDGNIMGVASSSKAKPLKIAGFSAADASFKDATCYCDWQFLYIPQQRKSMRPPATPTTPPRTLPTPAPGTTPSPVRTIRGPFH